MSTKDEELFSQALDNINNQITDVLALLALKRPEEAQRDFDSCKEFFNIAMHAANASGVNPLSQQAKILRILELSKTAEFALLKQSENLWSKAISAIKGLIATILTIVGLPTPDFLLLERSRGSIKKLN